MYKRMFKSLDPATQKSTARMILIMLRSKEVPDFEPMSLLQLALVDNEDITVEKAITEETWIMPSNKRRSLCLWMKRRIDGHTKGLLEVTNQDNIAERGSSAMDAWVEFYHKTAIDFFRSDETWDLLKARAGSDFDIDLTLFISCLLEMKALPSERAIVADADRSVANLRQGLMFAGFLEDRNLRPYTALLDNMEKTMKLHWAKATMFKKRASNVEWTATRQMTFERFVFKQADWEIFEPDNTRQHLFFLSVAMEYGWYRYAAGTASWEESVTAQQRTSLTRALLVYYMTREPILDCPSGMEAVRWIVGRLHVGVGDVPRRDVYHCWNIFASYLSSADQTGLRSDNASMMDLYLAFLNDRKFQKHPEMTARGIQYLLRECQSRVIAANPSGAKSDSTQQDLDKLNAKYDKAQTILTKWKKHYGETWLQIILPIILPVILVSLIFLSDNLSFGSFGGPDRIRDL